MSLVTAIDRRFYAGFDRNWDDRLLRDRILRAIKPDANVLDLGAGAGIIDAMNFRGMVRRVCGVDLDLRVQHNCFLDEGRVADAKSLPYPNDSFDVVFADNVIEHLDEPVAVFAEVRRVLRPGGRFLFKTPNKNHYMPLIARLTPHRFHGWINSLRGRKTADTFPTRYLCNTPDTVKTVAAAAGLGVTYVELVEGRPEYLRWNWATYLIGLGYERLVNSTPKLANLRVVMIASLTKPSKQ